MVIVANNRESLNTLRPIRSRTNAAVIGEIVRRGNPYLDKLKNFMSFVISNYYCKGLTSGSQHGGMSYSERGLGLSGFTCRDLYSVI